MLVTLPNVLSIDESRYGSSLRQIGERSVQRKGSLPKFTGGRTRGFLFRPADGGEEVLIISDKKKLSDRHTLVVQATVKEENGVVDLSHGRWLRHPLRDQRKMNYDQKIREILASWECSAFNYVREDPDRSIAGLRSPQIGAIHAVHAHWAVSESPATIVMPTGTGKTDTMISIFVSSCCPKVLVIVPTDALRTQLAEAFLSLGVLKAFNCAVLRADAQYPIVCALRRIPRSLEEVDDIFACTQVIVTTSSIAGQSSKEVQERMAYHCPYLFIDEAHHIEAPTWSTFKERFRGRRIVQFTATPFREDGKLLEGDIIFKYPLKKAQQEGYFKPIQFMPVVEFNQRRSDEAIAEKAVEQLRKDYEKGHILMARVGTIVRAEKVFKLYNKHKEFKPVQIHSGITSQRKKDDIRRQIITGESRIVVCVDMLGEGFDLPELKIAAFHDIRKTLAVTLQLAGRFTRSRSGLGNATFIANTADVIVRDELRRLYTRDPDWDVLLPQLSDGMIDEQLSFQEFLRGFRECADEIPLKSVRPAVSTVVYKTNCDDWTPENFRAGIPAIGACARVHETTNHVKHTLVIVTARRVPLAWTDVEDLFSWQWELYVVIWSPTQNLLFVNGSTNSGDYKALAKAIGGESAELIKGRNIFRAFAGVNRLRLQNVGLTEQLGRNVRYTGRMGADVGPALSDTQRGRVRRSVLSGTGFEDGERVSVGASRKGRIWSHRRNRVDELAVWCEKVGTKLLDESIDPDKVLEGTLESSPLSKRPTKMPINIDWPEEIYTESEVLWHFVIGGTVLPLSELSIEMVSPSIEGALVFAIASSEGRAEFELELIERDLNPEYHFILRSGNEVLVGRGENEDRQVATAFFYEHPPKIWFADGSSLEGHEYVELKTTYARYDANKIVPWTWDDVNITRESQGEQKERDTIQARVIRELQLLNYAIIFDDDGKGEAADVVAIHLEGGVDRTSRINVEFYHCKYSHGAIPGQRIEDLYEVCGQAQKSILWMSSGKQTDLFTHLLRRESLRVEKGRPTRYEKGDEELLVMVKELSHLRHISLKVHIVQPGLSKINATPEQLQLLSVTENYLFETYQIGFGVIASG